MSVVRMSQPVDYVHEIIYLKQLPSPLLSFVVISCIHRNIMEVVK